MSLINEALKRAKQTQDRQSPMAAADPPLEPAVEPRRRVKRTAWLVVDVSILLLASCFCLSVWWRNSGKRVQPLPVASRGHDSRGSATNPAKTQPVGPLSHQPASTRDSAPLAVSASSATRSFASIPVVASLETTARQTVASTSLETEAKSNVRPKGESVTQEVNPGSPASGGAGLALRLEAIHYRLKESSVRINGNTLFVGDEVEGARVISIQRQLVRLVSQGQTNVLRLL